MAQPPLVRVALMGGVSKTSNLMTMAGSEAKPGIPVGSGAYVSEAWNFVLGLCDFLESHFESIKRISGHNLKTLGKLSG